MSLSCLYPEGFFWLELAQGLSMLFWCCEFNVQLPCCVQNPLFPIPSDPSFLLSLPQISLSLVGRAVRCMTLLRAETPKPLILCVMTSWRSLCWLPSWIYFLLSSSPTDLTCTKDRLSTSFCQTLKSMKKCSVPSVRVQCCLSCPQAQSIHTQRQRKQQMLQSHDTL